MKKTLQHTIPANLQIVNTQTTLLICDAPADALYAELTRRFAAGSPYSTSRAAWQGHEHLTDIAGIAFSLTYINKIIYLRATTRRDHLGSLAIATRRGHGQYEVSLARPAFDTFMADVLPGYAPTDEALASAAHPADLVAADLAAEYAALGQPFIDRLYRAVDLVKAGQTEFPKYDTRWEHYGFYGLRLCGCPDAQHRNVSADRIGVCCKHTLAQLIKSRIDGDIQRAGYRKAADAWQRAAGRCEVCGKPATGIDGLCDDCYNATAEPDPATALPASAGDTSRIEDYLGYEEPTEKPWYLKADPINRSRAGAGRSQFTVHRGRD